MGRYVIRRLLTAVLTLLVISFVLFAILNLAPNDPTANLPMTIPPEVRQQIRQSLGLGRFIFVIFCGCDSSSSTSH
jgi:peptide/nickel transport system permease protein